MGMFVKFFWISLALAQARSRYNDCISSACITSYFAWMSLHVSIALPKTNMALARKPSQKETSLATIHFQVRTVSFREGKVTHLLPGTFSLMLFEVLASGKEVSVQDKIQGMDLKLHIVHFSQNLHPSNLA